jgi:hypothetical protein
VSLRHLLAHSDIWRKLVSKFQLQEDERRNIKTHKKFVLKRNNLLIAKAKNKLKTVIIKNTISNGNKSF